MVDVSVIVPAYNEEKYLPNLLECLRKQETRFTFEVIVTDDGSTDRTTEVAQAFGAVVIPNEAKLDVVGMRNLGLMRSRGRTILFTDADTAFSPRFLERMAEPMLREGSEYDMTQAMWQEPLERVAPVEPNEPYSRSYLWWLRHGPKRLVGRSPVRLLRWILRWVGGGFRTPLMELGDRARTGMVLARRELVFAVGGRRGVFGAHEDTTFTFDCLAKARKTRWIRGVTMYTSARRTMPAGGVGWVFRPLWKHIKRVSRFWKWITLGYRREEQRRAEAAHAAYEDVRGRR